MEKIKLNNVSCFWYQMSCWILLFSPKPLRRLPFTFFLNVHRSLIKSLLLVRERSYLKEKYTPVYYVAYKEEDLS